MKLRPIQERCLEDLWTWFVANAQGNPIVDACVGAGKSLLLAAVAQRAHREAPGTRILVIVHQKELLQQNVEKLMRLWPGADVGMYSAAVGRKSTGNQLIYSTIGSIYKKASRLGRIDIIMCDECHLVSSKDQGMWRDFLREMSLINPHARVIGWTGTPFRGNGVWLTAGEKPLFTSIAARITMTEMLQLGYLCPLVPVRADTQIDASGVAIDSKTGDYKVSGLAAVADKSDVVSRCCAEIVRRGANRKRWLAFAVTVDHAGHVRDGLRELGVTAEVVTADTPKAEREALISAYRSGRIRCLVNVAVLTTGFDVPEIDLIALLRETKSPVLYVQIAGRGMRCVGGDLTSSIKAGKSDCLWLDFTSTTRDMGPVDQIKGRGPSPKGSAPAPFRICDACGEQNHASAAFCKACGAAFPEPVRVRHGDEADTAAVLSMQTDYLRPWYDITNVAYKPHQKLGAPTSMAVEYFSGPKVVAREWVALEHPGYGRLRAEAWWTERAGIGAPLPINVEQGIQMSGQLTRPKRIQVSLENKYPEIISYDYQGETSAA